MSKIRSWTGPPSIFSKLDNKNFMKRTGYVTDIEGNYDYWKRYIAISKVLEQRDKVLYLKDNTELVFGGDICDRGPGDIRLLKDMIHLKQIYPERVHIILGNRDINKLRLLTELHKSSLSHPGKVYWIDDFHPVINDNGIDRLKWILSKTMGAPAAFEYRRKELEIMNLSFSDQDVVTSFLDSVKPDGLLTKYLSLGQIAHIVGDVLFVHGAIRSYNAGWIPPGIGETKGRKISNPHDWCREINKFCHQEIQEYISSIMTYIEDHMSVANADKSDIPYFAMVGGYDCPQPGSRLLQYGMGWMRDKSINRSAIYASYLRPLTPLSEIVNAGRNTSPRSGSVKPSESNNASMLSKFVNSKVLLVVGWLLSEIKALLSFLFITSISRLLMSDWKPDKTRIQNQEEDEPDMTTFQFMNQLPDMAFKSQSSSEKQSCIRKIVVGHQPRGDATLVLDNFKGLQILSCDTSYATNVEWEVDYSKDLEAYQTGTSLDSLPSPPKESTRGITVSEILFDRNGENSDTLTPYIHGQLSNRIYYCFELEPSGKSMVGRRTIDGWYVKARGIYIPNKDFLSTSEKQNILTQKMLGPYYLLTFDKNWKVKNKLMLESDLIRELTPVN